MNILRELILHDSTRYVILGKTSDNETSRSNHMQFTLASTGHLPHNDNRAHISD